MTRPGVVWCGVGWRGVAWRGVVWVSSCCQDQERATSNEQRASGRRQRGQPFNPPAIGQGVSGSSFKFCQIFGTLNNPNRSRRPLPCSWINCAMFGINRFFMNCQAKCFLRHSNRKKSYPHPRNNHIFEFRYRRMPFWGLIMNDRNSYCRCRKTACFVPACRSKCTQRYHILI